MEALIQILNTDSEKQPAGKLRIVDKKSYIQYYWRKESADLNGIYLSKDKIPIAKALAQRDYNQKLLSKALEEYKLISKYEEYVEKNDFETVYTDLHRGRRALVVPYVQSKSDLIKEWLSETYEPMPISDNTEFYSNNETRVRSKSELIIANLLEQYDIPYKYEKPLYLRGLGMVRPDFTCLNVRQQKEYVWEHFGMMDNSGYACKNIEKLSIYQQNGFFQGTNMITTFETLNKPLSTKMVKEIIREYLL